MVGIFILEKNTTQGFRVEHQLEMILSKMR
jgi:hypothetical protein